MTKIKIRLWKDVYVGGEKIKKLSERSGQNRNNFFIHVTTGFIAVMFGFMFLNKFYIGRIIFAFIFLHELCHLFCFLIFGADIREIILNPFGVSMIYPFTMCQSYMKDVICYLSAPAFNICVALFFKYNFPPTFYVRIMVAVNLLIGVFNLLPVGDLDGGQIIKSIFLMKFSPYTAELICFIISLICLVPLSLGSLVIFFRTKNPTAVITCVFLLVKIFTCESGDKD
ncbi:MAG: site-2 protease family protein [Oscillospiraceae bacterium]